MKYPALTVPPAAAPFRTNLACGACGPWAAYWYAWQRARALAAAQKPKFDPRWN